MKEQRFAGRRRAGAVCASMMWAVLAVGVQAQAPAKSAASDTTTIDIHSTAAALAFDPDAISVKAGSVVRIRYHNESTFSHNMVLLRKEGDIEAIGAASFNAGETGFVPMEHKDKMIAWSPLASPGKTVEFTFVAPPAGEYPYVCFVDGHFNMMIGRLRSR